jgi:hypothetical protein
MVNHFSADLGILKMHNFATLEFHTGRWPTPLHETAFLGGGSVYNFTAVGTEVGFSLVRKSPF